MGLFGSYGARPVKLARDPNLTKGVTMIKLSAVAVSALLLAGCSAPGVASETVPAPAVTAAADALDAPSGIQGLTIAELQHDADETLASVPEAVPAGAYAFIPEYAASYEATAPAFPADYFTMESFDRPGIIHVFHVTTATRA